MKKHFNILYIHGMGGGADSRIPAVLNGNIGTSLPADCSADIIVRTYSFDPDISREQIAGWVGELKPELIIGESLGALNSLTIRDIPHILISPSLNAPLYFSKLAFLTLIPGVTRILDRIYRPQEGERQKLHFTWKILRKYGPLRKRALENSPAEGNYDYFHAFFGTHDHYRKSGIVSVKTWEKYFGRSYTLYDGTHFMEEEFITALLIPEIIKVLGIKD